MWKGLNKTNYITGFILLEIYTSSKNFPKLIRLENSPSICLKSFFFIHPTAIKCSNPPYLYLALFQSTCERIIDTHFWYKVVNFISVWEKYKHVTGKVGKVQTKNITWKAFSLLKFISFAQNNTHCMFAGYFSQIVSVNSFQIWFDTDSCQLKESYEVFPFVGNKFVNGAHSPKLEKLASSLYICIIF